MRRGLLMVAVLAVCTFLRLPAQVPPPPGVPMVELPGPHSHARATAKDAAATPEVYFDASRMGSPVVLDKNWRVGITADQAAAQPDFDDTKWAVRNASEGFAEVSDEDHVDGTKDPDFKPGGPGGHHGGHARPFAWFRIHVKLAPDHGPLALLVELPVAHTTTIALGAESPVADVFANGKLISGEGPNGERPDHYQPISRVYRLQIPPGETSLVVVMRTIYIPFGYAAYTSFFSKRTIRLGSPEDMDSMVELWSNHSLFERLPRLINSILLIVLGMFLLALYFTQRGHVEYLWLALHEFTQAPLSFIELEGSSARLDQLLYAALFFQLVAISAYFYFEFLVSFLDLRRKWAAKRKVWLIKGLRYSAPLLALVGPSFILVGHNSQTSGVLIVLALVVCLFWWVGWLLFCLIVLMAATAKRNFEAGLLLFPLILTFVGILEPVFTTGMSDWTGHGYQSPLTLLVGPVPIHFASIADFAGLLAIVIIIFIRFLRIQRDRERASSELAAARSVQELMIPHERINTPGFEVDSIYNPANEVGGDFYHVEATGDGGLLVVIGDVAGKGLKAAMNVSMLMGALRRIPEHAPAKILESLNRVLVGSESFTTCQAAWFGPNGELVLSNAGHLPPYLNTQEVAVPGGLPLGVIPELTYEEVRLYLHPGDRLLLMSDGVVEARHPTGELFGFDRVHNLSNQSAFYIADAAKEFGQEDDITVLTIRRLAHALAA